MAFKEFAGNDFPDGKVAFHTLKSFVTFVNFSTAFGTSHIENAEVSGDSVQLETLGPVHDVTGHIGNTGHKIVPAFLPALNLAELKFPVARQFRFGQFRNTKAIEQF